jgi:hypothetical protein
LVKAMVLFVFEWHFLKLLLMVSMWLHFLRNHHWAQS